MKTFEENLNAWLEGRLTGDELAEFEASLPEISEAELAQQEDRKLTALLKTHLVAPTMTNQEFFNHQLLDEIERDMPELPQPVFAEPRRSWWSIGRLVWTGAASLAIFAVCTFFVIQQENPDRPVDLSDADHERADHRSRREPGRDDHDVRVEGREGDRPLGRRIAVAPVRIRRQVIPMVRHRFSPPSWRC